MINSPIEIRSDFPILSREIRPGVKLVYLDSSATSQKPETVIEAMNAYYRRSNANIHRGIHVLAEEATAAYELARQRIAKFINARVPRELIFTRNTTESINLIAYTWGRRFLKRGDLIILTEMEHHSNLVPWHLLAEEKGLRLEFIPFDGKGLLDLETYDRLLKLDPKLVSFTHMSNVFGTINPARQIIEAAHTAGAITLLDGAQSVPHFPVDVQELGIDLLAFSAHKMLGPTGIGGLYGKEALLQIIPPFLGGGDMIKKVHLHSFTPNEIPHKFEAGTPAIAEAIGFGAAVDYLSSLDMHDIADHERTLLEYALGMLNEFKDLNVLGPASHQKGGVIAFTMDGVHPHDVAQILDMDGIAVRGGHHCAMPLHEKLNIPATTRASLYLYNTREDIDKLMIGLDKVRKVFG